MSVTVLSVVRTYEAIYSLDEVEFRHFFDDFYALECSSVCSLEIFPLAPSVEKSGSVIKRLIGVYARDIFLGMLHDALHNGLLFVRWDNYRVDDILPQRVKLSMLQT